MPWWRNPNLRAQRGYVTCVREEILNAAYAPKQLEQPIYCLDEDRIDQDMRPEQTAVPAYAPRLALIFAVIERRRQGPCRFA